MEKGCGVAQPGSVFNETLLQFKCLFFTSIQWASIKKRKLSFSGANILPEAVDTAYRRYSMCEERCTVSLRPTWDKGNTPVYVGLNGEICLCMLLQDRFLRGKPIALG